MVGSRLVLYYCARVKAQRAETRVPLSEANSMRSRSDCSGTLMSSASTSEAHAHVVAIRCWREDPIGRAASRRRRGQSRRDLFAKKESALAHSSAETHRAALAAASRARVKAQRAETRVPFQKQIQCARDRTVPAPSCRARAHPKPTPMLSRSAAGGGTRIGQPASRRRRGQSRRDLFAKRNRRWLTARLRPIALRSPPPRARALKRSEQRQECPFQKQIQCARARTVPAPSCRARAHPKPTPMLSRSAAGGEDPHRSSRLTPAPRPKPSRSF